MAEARAVSAGSEGGRTLRRIDELVRQGLVSPAETLALERVAARYAVAVSPAVLDLIDRADPADPIARQFIPDARELVVTAEERADPIGDVALSPVKGIVHRYPDRVLLKPTHVCPVYCRFCFRREQVGPEGEALNAAELAAALDYIRGRPEIFEVIVTGGDPFILAPRRIGEIVGTLDAIGHLGAIRFHTRVPVATPERIDDALVASLGACKPVYVAIHANHPREITADFRAACRRLAGAGIGLLAQTVLLRGVNDDAAVLEALLRALVAAGVKPYYLHHPDLARGTSHFRLSLAEGRALVTALRGRISGLCQPTYVLDIPGGAGKVPVARSAAEPLSSFETWEITDHAGGRHRYPPSEEG
jgi:lysine 2,3-aminomutase